MKTLGYMYPLGFNNCKRIEMRCVAYDDDELCSSHCHCRHQHRHQRNTITIENQTHTSYNITKYTRARYPRMFSGKGTACDGVWLVTVAGSDTTLHCLFVCLRLFMMRNKCPWYSHHFIADKSKCWYTSI